MEDFAVATFWRTPAAKDFVFEIDDLAQEFFIAVKVLFVKGKNFGSIEVVIL